MKDKIKNYIETHPVVSIRIQILTIMVVFCAIMFFTIWLFQIVLLDDFYRGIKEKAVESTSSQIVQSIENVDVSTTTAKEIEEQLKSISIQNDSCALIRNISNGTTISVTTNSTCPLRDLSILDVQALWQKAVDEGGIWSSYLPQMDKYSFYDKNIIIQKEDQQTLVQVRASRDASGDSIVTIMGTVIKPVNIVRDTLMKQLFNVILIILLCSLLVSYLLAKIIANPIRKINDKAKQLAEGNYAVSFDGKGYLEVAQLSNTLNYAATELSKVESLRQELIANVSHDLRTPLTMISGYAEVMRDIPGENTPENVQIIIDEANRLSSMVNNLLDISKLQSGNEELNLTVVNLTEMMEEIISRYQKMLEAKGFTFTFQYDEKAEVETDVTRMQQVVYNLLNNAVNYSTDQKVIEVKQTVYEDKLRVDIIDHGVGVKKEDLPYIWNRYYKVDKEHKRSVTGSGLGLSIVKTILDKHHAEYGVISEYGKGSDFYFILPIRKEGN